MIKVEVEVEMKKKNANENARSEMKTLNPKTLFSLRVYFFFFFASQFFFKFLIKWRSILNQILRMNYTFWTINILNDHTKWKKNVNEKDIPFQKLIKFLKRYNFHHKIGKFIYLFICEIMIWINESICHNFNSQISLFTHSETWIVNMNNTNLFYWDDYEKQIWNDKCAKKKNNKNTTVANHTNIEVFHFSDSF